MGILLLFSILIDDETLEAFHRLHPVTGMSSNLEEIRRMVIAGTLIESRTYGKG